MGKSSAFSGLKDAKRGYSSNSIKGDGKYVVRIDECAHFDTDQNGEMWKTTVTILAVEDGAHRLGEVGHIFYGTKKGKKMFQQNLKGFLAGVLNVADDEIGEEEAELAASENSPMLGLVTVLTTRTRKSKTSKDDNGNPFDYTTYDWSPSLDAAEIRAAIGEEAVARFFPNGLGEE